jgi:uncharacterized protein YgbK (DUF1537 family)
VTVQRDPPPVGRSDRDLPLMTIDPGLLHSAVVRSGRRVVVIDDDPTGSQSVADVPIVTQWTVSDLRWALVQPATTSFVLTNSRSMSDARTRQVNTEIVAHLAQAAAELTLDVSIVSRGDSTLRGHFLTELDAITESWERVTGRRIDVTVVCPAYPEAGRVTVDDVHWATIGSARVPVAETEFARDPTFAFRNSNLRDWIEERSAGRWPAPLVESISLEDIRMGGPSAVARKLQAHKSDVPIVVNAADPSDLDVVALGVLIAESQGTAVLCRTGPSFVRARAGLPQKAPLTPSELRLASSDSASNHGLVVVGSHVQLSTQQMHRALELGGFAEIEVDVAKLLDPPQSGAEVASATMAVVTGLQLGDVLIRTSRDVSRGSTPEESLKISASVAEHLAAVVSASVQQAHPRWVVGKGGTTSSDVATIGLGLRRAWVLGQMLQGQVSVWGSGSPGESAQPLCAIFPGNVGDVDSLAEVVTRLRNLERAPAC